LVNGRRDRGRGGGRGKCCNQGLSGEQGRWKHVRWGSTKSFTESAAGKQHKKKIDGDITVPQASAFIRRVRLDREADAKNEDLPTSTDVVMAISTGNDDETRPPLKQTGPLEGKTPLRRKVVTAHVSGIRV